ncbi:MAG: hypothetical protein KJ990_02235 [Proteobacteria bacterium]|nr:hypothetical protein [Pseudomonadota bacterium]MBU1649311.1 hypothetical protein [Pseudomonadota bacterium]
MKNRRKHPRLSTPQDVELFLYNRDNDSPLTGRVAAWLSDLSKDGAGLKFSKALIDGQHLFYAALDSDTIFIVIVFRPTDDDTENITTLLARPIWFDRDMEDSVRPFRMGVHLVDHAPSSVLNRFGQE